LLLYQNQDGFLFNSDSHFLYDFISQLSPKGKILDIGSGCGILGLLVARDFKVKLTGIDKQENNVFLSQKNAQVNNIDANFFHGDYFEYDFREKFDFIISNPPYYHDGVSKSQNQSLHISRYNIHLPLENFIQKTCQILKPHGHFIFCYDAKQIQNILLILHKFKLTLNTLQFVHGSDKKPSSLVFIHARNNSKALTKILPPIFPFINGQNSEMVKKIYNKTRTYSIKCSI
jgi:tRNA1(Val) A37 N6-methylase TrmN6